MGSVWIQWWSVSQSVVPVLVVEVDGDVNEGNAKSK